MATKELCGECGRDPIKHFREWKSGKAEPCINCLELAKPRLKVIAKKASTTSRSKVIENQVSRYLFDHDRLWKEREDIGNDGWCGEVKNYSLTTIASSGGAWQVLTDALNQTKEVAGDRRPFSVLHAKGKPIEASLVMFEHFTEGTSMVVSIEVFKSSYLYN